MVEDGSTNWDSVLESVFEEVAERKRNSIEVAYELQDIIRDISRHTDYGHIVTVELVNSTVHRNSGISIYKKELYYEPEGSERDRFFDILEQVGEDISFAKFQELHANLKEILIEKLDIVDPNNIPEEVLIELKEMIFENYNSSNLGKMSMFFQYNSKDIENISRNEENISVILPGDILIRVAADGFIGKVIYIRGDQITDINLDYLSKRLKELITLSNKEFEDDILNG